MNIKIIKFRNEAKRDSTYGMFSSVDACLASTGVDGRGGICNREISQITAYSRLERGADSAMDIHELNPMISEK